MGSKLFGKYLRTNYRVTGRHLDSDAIGEAIWQGSWGGGAGTKRWCGGFVMGSFNSAATDSCLVISAAGAIASFYGSAPGWSDVTGFKIFPVNVHNASMPRASQIYQFGFSVSAAGDSCFGILANIWSAASAGHSGLGQFAQSIGGASIHIVWFGWIVSGPT